MKKIILILTVIFSLSLMSCEKSETVLPTIPVLANDKESKNLDSPKHNITKLISMMETNIIVSSYVYKKHPTVFLEKTIKDLKGDTYMLKYGGGYNSNGEKLANTNLATIDYQLTDVIRLMKNTLTEAVSANVPQWVILDTTIGHLKDDMYLLLNGGK